VVSAESLLRGLDRQRPNPSGCHPENDRFSHLLPKGEGKPISLAPAVMTPL